MMEQTVKNRRKFERLHLNTPAAAFIAGSSRAVHMQTRDLSAGGGFFYTSEPVSKDQKIRIEMVITNKTIAQLTGTPFQLKVSGTVVRNTPTGIAVHFRSHKIKPLRKPGETKEN